MRFVLVDNIVELVRGERIVTTKAVSADEEYLADHFPTFPVLPGVLMLQAMVESAAWLVRDALDFAPSLILLSRARNVTYRSFVKPGNLLTLKVTCRRLAQGESEFDGAGYCNETEVVKGRFSLTHSCLASNDERLAVLDRRLVSDAKALFDRLREPLVRRTV